MAQTSKQSDWEAMWDEADGDVSESRPHGRFKRTGRKNSRFPMLPSTKLLVIATGFWVASIVLIVLGFFAGNSGSTSTVLGFFLVCLVVSAIAAAFASFLALFGLFKYRRRKVFNLILLLISVATNPLVILMVAMSGVA
ncbi:MULTISPECIES: hypothetical protein [Micrococcales]|uniref:hypothetical protein n=1 Tax=Micrococcales TaxID=85006 RepID=UPI0004AB7C96|nr:MULTISPECIES: hypothetical protein [Micrococcales]